jgi:hypothetical protein
VLSDNDDSVMLSDKGDSVMLSLSKHGPRSWRTLRQAQGDIG